MKISDMNIGLIGEHLTIADLMLKGFDAFGTMQGKNYDVVFDYKGMLVKLQVKTTKRMVLRGKSKNPIYFFNVKRCGKHGARHYKEGDFDGYALVALDRKLVFYAHFDECKKNSICVRDESVDYSGHRGGGRQSNFYCQQLTLERLIRNYDNLQEMPTPIRAEAGQS